MFLYVDQLLNQLDKDEFQEDKSVAAFWVLNNQFQKFIDWQYFLDYDSEMTGKRFAELTGIKVKQFRETLLLHMGNVKKSLVERTRHKRQYDRRMNERQMQSRESKAVSSKALDASLVVTECSRTKSNEHITSSSSGTYITHVVDTDIRPVNDQVPSVKVDSNTNPDSTNMCHRGGEIDQDTEQYKVKSPFLNAELVKSKEMIEKKTYNELSRMFLILEKHCISLEISIQQKEESFQSNKPCKNQDAPEFREFFEINYLKAQLQAKTILICNLKNQIKSVKEASNEAKVKIDIDVIETINIKLEHSVAKLLTVNEQLHKENEHLKQTYKELYDLIKKTRVQNKDNSDSLISQINQKSVENADLKAQIQEKFASQVDEKNDLSKVRESAAAKPHQVGRKKTHDKTRIPNYRDMASARAHCTPNDCTPKPRNIFRCLHVSKSSCVPSNVVPLVDHSRNSMYNKVPER
ncbi:hypothetical protein Tco_0374524, partial [Tanacetum coccineum]